MVCVLYSVGFSGYFSYLLFIDEFIAALGVLSVIKYAKCGIIRRL